MPFVEFPTDLAIRSDVFETEGKVQFLAGRIW